MKLTTNEQTLFDTLVQMEADGTITEPMKETLAQLRKVMESEETNTNTNTDSKDCFCAECTWRNLKVPSHISVDSKEYLGYMFNSIVANIAKSNLDQYKEWLNDNKSSENQQFIQEWETFFEELAEGKFIETGSIIPFNNLLEKGFEERTNVKGFDMDSFKQKLLDLKSDKFRSVMLSMHVQTVESFISNYAKCNHQAYGLAKLEEISFTRVFLAFELCKMFDLECMPEYIYGLVQLLDEPLKRCANFAGQLPQTTYTKPLVIKDFKEEHPLEKLMETIIKVIGSKPE